MKPPEVSIIIPCYKKAEYLPETLESVLKSDFENYEVIIVNDGSPDNTEEIAQNYMKKDSRIKYIKQENKGVSAARNTGIKNAKAEYILPLDPDDLISPKYISLAIEELNKNPNLGVVYCEAKQFKQNKRWGKKWFLGYYNLIDFLGMCNIFNSSFFRKKDWEKIGGYDETLIHGIEDWEFWINLLTKTQKSVLKLNYCGFYHRVETNNSRGEQFHKNENDKYDTLQYIYDKHKDVYQKYYGNLSMYVIMEMAFYKYKFDKLSYSIKNILKIPLVSKIIG